MIATIDVNGMLTVRAENGLEGYALKRWAEANEAAFGNGLLGLLIVAQPPEDVEP